jgi:uncharacterized protein YjlB
MAQATVESYRFEGDGRFPNSELPVLVYRGAIPSAPEDVETLLRANLWAPAWRASIGFYPFNHFHSNAHEVVAIVAGEARGRLGGPNGASVTLRAGDAVLIPAGVCHFGEYSSADIVAIGAYPACAPEPDMRKGDPAEYALSARRAAATPVPSADPILGAGGPLGRHWRAPTQGPVSSPGTPSP